MSVRAHRRPAPERATTDAVPPRESTEPGARPAPPPRPAPVGGRGLAPSGRGTIRGRLLRILALPLVVVLILLGVVVNGDLSDYSTARQTTSAVRLVLGVQDLVQELQTERGLTAGFLGGDVGFQKEMVASRTGVDTQRGKLANLLSGATGSTSAARSALSQLDATIASTRNDIDQKKIDRTVAFDYFTGHIAALDTVTFGLDSSSDRDLRRGVTALTALSSAKEQYAQERALLNGVFSAGGYAAGEYQRYALIVATKTQALATYDQNATAGQRWVKDYALDTGAAREAKFYEARALGDSSRIFKEQTNPQSWWSAFTTVLDDLRTAQEAVGSDITAIAKGLQTEATQRLAVLAGLVVAGSIGAALVLIFSARAITRPLRALVREADWLAQHRLPEAVAKAQAGHDDAIEPPPPVLVPPGASSEIVSVAGALDQVQSTAYLLATEQATLRRSTAESLANLGRRNQNLLRRQLSFITRLEQEESDPQGLANLFELDHLATRMRRNAESLLVLVGEATPRRWAAPLPIADVIRAAISEVEEYRRVSLKRIDDGWVGGAYVAGIAHMIAELVENGLSFSPPDLDVEIQGRNIGGRYLIAITDQGVGMESAEIDRANARLRGEESYLSVPTRFLGHYVVGHLAEQMGVEVEISPSPVTGVTARVTLPSPVLAQPPALAAGGAGLAAAQAQSRAATAARANRAAAATQVAEAQIVGESSDAGWSTAPARALGTRPVVEYVPMDSAHAPQNGDSYGYATTALPMVDAEPPSYSGYNGQSGYPAQQGYPSQPGYGGQPGYPDRGQGADTGGWSTSRPPASPRLSAQHNEYDVHTNGGQRTSPGYPGQVPGRPSETYSQPVTPAPARYPDPAPSAAPAAGGSVRDGYPGYPGAQPGVDRTTNGLVKRVPRSRTTSTTTAPGPEPSERYAPMDASPSSVRSRLTSLREGMARGEGERGAQNRTHPDQHR